MALAFEFERQRRADRLTLVPDDEHEAPPAAGAHFDAGACGNASDQQDVGMIFTHGNLRMRLATLRMHLGRARIQVIGPMGWPFQKMRGRAME